MPGCQDDICPCNISPGDICPYKQYLTQFQLNLLNPIFGRSKFYWTTHYFVRRKLLESKIIWTQNYLGPKILGSNICGPKLIWIQNFILTQLFFTQNFLDPKLFEHTNFLDTKCLCTQNFVLTYHADFL